MARDGKWTVFVAFAVIYIVWGSTYFAILLALDGIPPIMMSALRFLTAGILLYTWCLLNKQPAPSLQSLRKNALPGILMLFGGTVSVAWSEQYLPSSLAAIIVTALPFWMVLLDRKQWSFYFSNKLIITGLLIGFAGVLILVGFRHSAHRVNVTPAQQVAGVLAVLAGGFAWALGSLYSKYKPAEDGLLMNASLQLLVSGVFTLVVSFGSGEAGRFAIEKVPAKAWMALSYLTVVSSIIAYLSYLYLLKIRPAAQVSTYVYVNPIIALLLGAVFADEKITLLQVVALVIILSGVLLVNLPKYKAAILSRFSNRT